MDSFNFGILQKHYQWPAVQSILDVLNAHGYHALLAGGCVRDALIGRRPNDLDVATNATPEAIEKLFPKTVAVGKQFGVMRVLIEGADIEVATFRKDGNYEDGRRPEYVVYSSAEEDAQRRDFTINALFYDIHSQQVIDYVGGVADLKKRILRTVGAPEARFKEDKLRILRAIRFVSQIGFSLDAETYQQTCLMSYQVTQVSAERIKEEMQKLLSGAFRGAGLSLLKSSGLEQVLFSGLKRAEWVPVPERAPWQLWCLFWLGTSRAQVQKWLQDFRFSSAEKKQILLCFEYLEIASDFLSKNLGYQLIRYAQAPVRLACEILVFRGFHLQQIQNLHKQWLEWGGKLPFPLLKGEDLEGYYKGADLGKALAIAYEYQIEERYASKEDIIKFVLSRMLN
ncbi:MAG: CCA tRNA nucleotidyltransferase [Bdellovibrionia bacterium]